jgi:hypothetical protein
MDGFTVDEVAAIFDANQEWVRWVIDVGLLRANTGPDGVVRVEALSVEALRRRMEARTKREGGLDPDEEKRVRRALRDGARAKIRALLDGRTYSTHPTIPPPAGSWPEDQEDHAYKKLLEAIRRPSAARALAQEGKAASSLPAAHKGPPSDLRHDEIPPPGVSPPDDSDTEQ